MNGELIGGRIGRKRKDVITKVILNANSSDINTSWNLAAILTCYLHIIFSVCRNNQEGICCVINKCIAIRPLKRSIAWIRIEKKRIMLLYDIGSRRSSK